MHVGSYLFAFAMLAVGAACLLVAFDLLLAGGGVLTAIPLLIAFAFLGLGLTLARLTYVIQRDERGSSAR